MTPRHGRLLLAVAALISPIAANATNGYFAHGYGMRSAGMAGVGIALPQDALAAATNPAGMVFVGDRFDLGVTLFRPDREATISGNSGVASFNVPSLDGTYDGNGKSNFYVPEFGLNRMLSTDLSAGVSVYGNGGMNTQYDISPFRSMGGSSPAGVDLTQLFISPTIAWRFAPGQAVGVALNLAYQQFEATGLGPFGAFGLSSDPANLTDRGNSRSTGYGLRIGWTGEVTPMLTLGATYQTRTRMSKFDEYSGLFSDQGDFDIPATYGLGAAAKLSETLIVALDFQRIEYSKSNPTGNTINGLFAGQLLGSTDGPGFGWNSINVFKLGVSWRATPTLVLRGGYSHAQQPVPAGQTFFNILAPGVIQDHLSLGTTWSLGGGSEITAMYTHAFGKTVRGQNSIPPAFGGGEADIRLEENLFGIAWSKSF